MRGVKNNTRLSESLICLSKLKADGNWPVSLRDDALVPEQKAYTEAMRAVFEKCRGRKLDLPTIEAVNRSAKALKVKAQTVIKNPSYKASALAILASMEKAQKMFVPDTVDFAEELIGDSQQHHARTVEELLWFMRKYRLRFGEADRDSAALYGELYALLREQKNRLGLGLPGGGASPKRVDVAQAEIQKLQGVWTIRSNEIDGRIAPGIAAENWTITFKGDEFTNRKGDTLMFGGTWRIDPTRDPKEIDMVITEGRDQGAVAFGIYNVDDDTLRLCIGKTRPREFKSVAGEKHQLVYYVRVAH
jgi:uncharacterized protein (TIGR03067 family)